MENQEVLDYIKEIKELEKKRVFWTRIIVAFVGVLVVGMLSMLPLVIKTLNNANEALSNANSAMNDAKGALKDATKTLDMAQDIMDELSDAIETMDVAVGSVTTLMDESSISLKEAFDNINNIDFEGLNKAIKDLGDVVEPLSKFFRKF